MASSMGSFGPPPVPLAAGTNVQSDYVIELERRLSLYLSTAPALEQNWKTNFDEFTKTVKTDALNALSTTEALQGSSSMRSTEVR